MNRMIIALTLIGLSTCPTHAMQEEIDQTHRLQAIDDAKDALACAIYHHIQHEQDEEEVANILNKMYDKFGPLGFHLCPFIMKNPSDENELIEGYIGHSAILQRNLPLLQAYLRHLGPEHFAMKSCAKVTMAELLAQELALDLDYSILLQMVQLLGDRGVSIPSSLPTIEQEEADVVFVENNYGLDRRLKLGSCPINPSQGTWHDTSGK